MFDVEEGGTFWNVWYEKKADFFKKSQKKVDIIENVFYILQNVKYIIGIKRG